MISLTMQIGADKQVLVSSRENESGTLDFNFKFRKTNIVEK